MISALSNGPRKYRGWKPFAGIYSIVFEQNNRRKAYDHFSNRSTGKWTAFSPHVSINILLTMTTEMCLRRVDKSFLMSFSWRELTTPNRKLLSWKPPYAFGIPVQWTLPPHVLGIPVDVTPHVPGIPVDVTPLPLRNSEMPPVVWVWIFSGTTHYKTVFIVLGMKLLM